MFLTRSIHVMPIVHTPTFVVRECDHLQLLGMIILGSIFIAGDSTTTKVNAASSCCTLSSR